MVKKIDSKQRTIELADTQRWEDEGGQIIKNDDTSSPDQAFVQAAPTPARRRVTSLRWNERFVIQPLQPGDGMLPGGKHAK